MSQTPESSPGARPALDIAFPSIALMAVILSLAIGLIFICGWKIFSLEQDERALAQERLLLDRDRDSFLTWGGELPQIEERHKKLTAEVARFEDRQKYLEDAIAGLEEQREKLNGQARDLMGAINELQGQKQAVASELAETRADLQKLKPQQADTQKAVDLLKAQETALTKSIAGKQKQEAALAASVEGLERSRAHAQELLDKMASEKENLAKFEKRLDDLAAKFDGVITKAGETAQGFSAKLEDIGRFQAKMDNGVAAMDMDLQSLAANLDALKKNRATWDTQLKTLGEHNRALQGQAEALLAANKRFAQAIETTSEMDRRFQATLLAEAAILNKMAQEDSQTRAQLSSAGQSLEQTANQLRAQLGETREDASQLRGLLGSQKSELEAVAGAVKSLAAQLEQGRLGMEASIKAGAALSQAALTLTDQAETLKARVKLADTHGGHMEKLLDSQNARMNELAQTARDLGAEIRENRRQSLAVEALLDKIQAALLKAGIGVPGEQTGKEEAESGAQEKE